MQGTEDALGTGPSSGEDDGDEGVVSSEALEAIDDVISGMQQNSSAGGVLESVLERSAPSAAETPQGITAGPAAVVGEQATESSQLSALASEDGVQGAPWQKGTGPQMLHFRQVLSTFSSLRLNCFRAL